MATQEERKAETRALLLDAAADLFARKGVHAVSVDAIAEAAGRTSGALYAHFGGKDGLLVELVDHLSRRAAARITADVRHDTGLEDRLAAIWQGWAAPDGVGTGGDDGSWSTLEHELWLEATRRPEVAERVAERFAAARDTTGSGLLAWLPDDGDRPGTSTSRPDEHPTSTHRASEVGTLALALLYGLEMQRRVDPTSVPDHLAVRGLLALLDA